MLHTFSTLRYCLLDILWLSGWLTWYTRTSSCINCVCVSFKIGQPLQKNSLNAIRLWFNCSLISMDKANVLHRVITANDCSERGAVCVCVLKETSEFFLSNRPFVELVPSACDKGVKN